MSDIQKDPRGLIEKLGDDLFHGGVPQAFRDAGWRAPSAEQRITCPKTVAVYANGGCHLERDEMIRRLSNNGPFYPGGGPSMLI